MKPRDLDILMTYLFPGSATGATVMRRLREAGLLETGKQGPHGARDLEPRDVALVILALAVTDNQNAAAAAAQHYAELTDEIAPGKPLLESLVALLTAEAAEAPPVELVEICRSWPWARIVYGDGSERTFGVRTAEQGQRLGFKTTPARVLMSIPGPVVHQLALELHAEAKGGWVNG